FRLLRGARLGGGQDARAGDLVLLHVAGDVRADRDDPEAALRGIGERLRGEAPGQALALERRVHLGVDEADRLRRIPFRAQVVLGETREGPVVMDLVTRGVVVAGHGDVGHASSLKRVLPPTYARRGALGPGRAGDTAGGWDSC